MEIRTIEMVKKTNTKNGHEELLRNPLYKLIFGKFNIDKQKQTIVEIFKIALNFLQLSVTFQIYSLSFPCFLFLFLIFFIKFSAKHLEENP